MQNSSQGVGATARRRAGAIARRPPPKPRGGPSALAGERSEPIWLGVRDHTHALFALKVQRKLSNGVAGFAAAGSSLDRQKSRAIRATSQRCRLMTNNAGRDPSNRTRAAYSDRRSSNANNPWWRGLADPTGIITISHIHGSRTDIRVRVLPPQPGSPVSAIPATKAWTRF